MFFMLMDHSFSHNNFLNSEQQLQALFVVVPNLKNYYFSDNEVLNGEGKIGVALSSVFIFVFYVSLLSVL